MRIYWREGDQLLFYWVNSPMVYIYSILHAALAGAPDDGTPGFIIPSQSHDCR